MKVKPKKSLGQNFLVNQSLAKKIVDLGNISTDDTVLEIGPGTGKLTEEIINKKPKKIIVIEKDENLVSLLKKKFDKKIEIINQDMLRVDEKKLPYKKIIVFGNLPYNISTQILVKLIKFENISDVFKKLIFMFQKEVADRINASCNDSKYGRISILSSWKFNIKKIKNIEPNSFYPPPKVRSTILEFIPKKKFTQINNPTNLEYITNVFFKQRRKMIKKPLSQLFEFPLIVSNKFKLDLNLRPQNLSPELYFQICKELEDSTK
tara:strand:+ start:344 stop:1135 length:792 start_codon:yes stop_codon:yes gene_type:complete